LGPGFKYHIVSISAIFFALTVGLVVGSVFVSPQFARGQETAIKKLQTTLNTDIEEKRQELKQYEECVAAISPLALRGKLGHATVAIIQTGDYPEAASRANEAIAMADPGGIIHLTVNPILDQGSEEVRRRLANLHATDPLFPADRDGLIQRIASLLAQGDSLSTPALPQLEREGIVRLTSDDTYAVPIKMAVIVAGSRNAGSMRTTRVDVPLIRALLKQGISVVACEPRDAQASDVPTFHALKVDVSTVDNVDTDMGQCALVLAFSGERGDYGVKPGAVHLLPLSPPAP
jgi:hypothetical protein